MSRVCCEETTLFTSFGISSLPLLFPLFPLSPLALLGGVKGVCGAVRFCMEGKSGGWQDGFCFEVGRGVLLQ